MSCIEYKKIKKRIVVLATQKLFGGLLLAKIGLDSYVAYGIIKLPTKANKEVIMKNENGEGAGISFVIMPIEILQDKNLTSSEKILYCYLSLFKKGVCFQSNDKLSEMTGLDESTIKRGLKKLSEIQYVYVEFLNNNSAMRRIYVVLDNPKKLAYLSRKGMFSLDKKIKEPDTEPAPNPEPILDISSMKIRPKRSSYSSDEEYEKAFYKWNSR